MTQKREVTMKKLNRIQKIAIAIVMAIAVIVPVAIAQSTDAGGGKEGHGRQWRERGVRGGGDMMGFRNLDLTDAQKAQIKQIHENSRQSLRPIMEEIRAKREEIRKASEGGTFNE